MKLKSFFLSLLLTMGFAAIVSAQNAVTQGNQVTAESNLNEGVPYIIYQPRNATYIKEASDRYSAFQGNTPDDTGIFYFVKVSNGVYKIKSHSTGKFISKPTTTGIAAIAPVEEASAGEWNLQFDSNGCIYPLCNGYGWDRGSNALWSTAGASTTYDESGNVKLYKIYEVALSTTALSDFADKDIVVNTTEAASISTGQWYVMKNRGRNGYAYENSGSLLNQAAAPSGSATDNAKFLVRFIDAGSGKYYLQNGLGNYFGAVPENTAVPTTAIGMEKYTMGKINSTDGHFYFTSETNGIVLDCQQNGYPVVGWGTTIPTSTNGNNDWAFFSVGLVESWTPTASEVYTINNTNASRGALIYNPDASTKFVWSSGKSGTFDASQANSQWVIIPTGTDKQYYLYNVGAGKFAIPTAIAEGAGYSWIFSDNAVAVIFETQNDGTKKIKMASTPVSGTNAAYMAVSNNYTGPIINYYDEGGNFTITKVDGQDQSVAANAAVAKLVKNQTALTSYPQATGWYVIQIKSKTGAASYSGRYLQTANSLYNDLYPLTFTGGVDVQPAITDPTFFTHIDYTDWNINNWQLPDGRYLVENSSSKFPTPSSTAGNAICGYENGNYFKSDNNWFADPYNSGANYFIGETGYMRTAYTVYPIDLSAAGITAWKMLCDDAPESALISCTRTDVIGLTSVYKNGFFFLPTGVTPESGDFVLDGAIGASVDTEAKTVTLNYNPDLAIVEEGVTVAQGYQTAGRGEEVMLLKVDAAPFRDATGVSIAVSLKNGSEANISKLTLYEASTSSPEILSAGNSGAPTKTQLAETTVSASAASLTIGNIAAGTHYYWIGATVKSDATLGAIIDAAVTGITYTCNDKETTLDLTSVGDPTDRGAMVFNTHNYPFLPRENGSRVYRIPAMVVADDGSIVVACDKRYDSHTDIGNGHVIDIVVRRSTDGGKTWSEPVVIAKGKGSEDNAKCGYGDPSLVKGKDGKLYCLFVAGNLGYFYGQQRIAMSTSTNNGVTWSSNETTAPIDLLESGRLKNYNTVGDAGYGLYDYFVTSGRGLYVPDDDILMYLIPAQTMTSTTEHTGNSQDYIFYSRDGGESWYFSPQTMFAGGDEAKIILMNDGSLLGSVRQGGNRGFNTATYIKNDDGKTLTFTMGSQWNNSQLNAGGYANNQDILYYQRKTVTGKTDVIIHSMTTGQHANFKLFYSTDGGSNWTEFLNVQTKGTRYVTMDKNPINGSLYLFFEDQSLNAAGGHTDYNHYPLNFIEITREQLENLIPALNDYAVPEYLESKVVKSAVYQTSTGCDSYGSFSGTGTGHWARIWTSNASSGMAGLTVSTESGYGFDQATVLSTRVMTLKPSADDATDTYTITAPAGYLISSYTIGGAVYTGGTYRITAADGTTTGDITSTTTPTNIVVNNVNASSTTFTFYGASLSNWFAITDFTVTLVKPLQLNVVGDASYATLYLPFDVTTDGTTKAYYVKTTSHWKDNDYATLQETSDNGRNIPANTAVVLVNDIAEANTVLTRTSGLTSEVDPEDNLLKGTLVPMSLDLHPGSSYYALGKSDSGEIGFYKFDDGESNTITLGANKAYLDVNGAFVKGFAFKFGNEDAIHTIGAGTSRKQQTIYNLAGQRVSRTVRGLYIVDGHKVVVK